MGKMRVYELAKELNIATKDLMIDLENNGIVVKSHMSSLDDEQAQKIKDAKAKKSQSLNQDQGKKEKKAEKNPKDSKPYDDKDKSDNSSNKNKGKHTDKNFNKANNSNKKNNQKNIKADNKNTNSDNKNSDNKKKNNKKKNNKKNSKKNHNKNKNNKENNKKDSKNNNTKEPKKPKKITMMSEITIKDLAEKSGISIANLIVKLMDLGIMANQNQEIDFDTASLVLDEFNIIVEQEEMEDFDGDDVFNLDFEDDEEDLVERPPVVTVMGHVDHGKTSILDNIRNSHVTKGEAGGITQHIGAYTINIQGKKIVFLDTPGHEAFTAMRSRGAQVTDISVLVVAADDGVMPQTLEAINHSKAAGVPIIVAVNKIDKPDANIERVKSELAENGLMPEDWGGEAIIVPVSAKTGEGIDDLLEMILMVAEMEELKANPNRNAIGTVIEAQLDKGKGPVATILVNKGTLHHNDFVFSGEASGRIRAMFNDKAKQVKKAGPSIPVQILGLNEVPEAGDILYAVDDEKDARNYAQKIKDHNREEMLKSSTSMNLDDLFGKISGGETTDLNIIIKTDVKGTIDAVKQSFEKLSNDEVRVNIIHGAVGGINESDVNLAIASNAVIIGFNVRPSQPAMDLAKEEKVDIRTYRVIYDAIEDIKNAITGMLKPEYREKVLGRAVIRDTFKVPNVGTVAGIYVTSGKVTRNSSTRLLRDDVVIFEGNVASLKRFKDDAKEITQGFEGGMGLENFNDVKVDDVIEAYVMEEIKR
ncbi:MAG: translation initiation factor IF-2 [Finegoldia sp.]|nr:translation initiation factor IF-2 [Finegoldia sp.]